MASINKRKSEHLNLAKDAQHNLNSKSMLEYGLTYEPCLAAFPTEDTFLPQIIGKKSLKHPFWISSMTGGSSNSGKINKLLAKLTSQFELGMGLGSCRVIMEQPKSLKDFLLKPILGNAPFWANLGICEVDNYLKTKKWNTFAKILEELEVDGLIVHINPTQEFLQPQGSKLQRPAIEILRDLVNNLPKLPLMIKEVGQGMGPKSLKALSQFPLVGIEFAALGGTNFATLEVARHKKHNMELNPVNSLTKLGHSAKEMVDFWINLQPEYKQQLVTWHVIISGGRGHDVLADVALFKRMIAHRAQPCSLGLGFSILDQAYKGEKNLKAWFENYLKAFYYLNNFTSLT